MKVLMIIPALGSIYGGPSKCILELARSLSDRGIDIDIATTNANGSSSLNVPLKTWIYEDNYRIQYFPYWGWADYKVSGTLAKWLFKHVSDYDLVHTHAIFSLPNLSAYWACQQQKIPYLITPHGMLEPWALSYKAWKKRIYYHFLEKPALNGASAIHLLASPEAEEVKSLDLKSPLVVIPNGIHDRDFEKLPNSNIFYQNFPETKGKTLILFLGRIDPKKGLDLLAPAFSKVCDRFSSAHLIVAGPDNIGFEPTARRYFYEAGCLDSVTFTGMLEGNLKYAALAASSIYISPSYSEGFSLSVLEGMASGLPCIITTGCNFPEAGVKRAARIVNSNSDEIATALIECLSHPQEAKEMGDRARQFILNRYTWNQITANLIELYTAIVDRKLIPNLYLSRAETSTIIRTSL